MAQPRDFFLRQLGRLLVTKFRGREFPSIDALQDAVVEVLGLNAEPILQHGCGDEGCCESTVYQLTTQETP